MNHFNANTVGIEMDQASLVSALVGIGSFLVMFNLMSYIKKTEVQVCPVDVKPEMYEADDEVEAEEEAEEAEEDDMPPLEPVSSETPSDIFDATTTIVNKIEEFYNAVVNTIADRNAIIDERMLENNAALEEKIMKNIKEWFVPLHAKKELDTTHYQGWLGEATYEAASLRIVIENRKFNTYEANDAWTDTNTADSIRYRDSLLSLDDSAWKIEFTSDPTIVNTFKEYSKPEWDGGISVSLRISNLKMGSSAKQILQDVYQKSDTISWKRVLFQTKSA